MRHSLDPEAYNIYSLAIDLAFHAEDPAEAWAWTELSKARAFQDSLRCSSGFSRSSVVEEKELQSGVAEHLLPPHQEENSEKGPVFVHWVTTGDTIYMLTRRKVGEPHSFRPAISYSTVCHWYSDIQDSHDDLSDPDTAEETLLELMELCRPLGMPEISIPGELLVLCPTKVLFKIPLHALQIHGEPMIERNPVVYTYAMSLSQTLSTHSRRRSQNGFQLVTFGSPTGDTPGGESSAEYLSHLFQGDSMVKEQASKEAYTTLCSKFDLIHYHGHIRNAHEPRYNVMIFHNQEELMARDIFTWDLSPRSPFVCLIGCGSGIEHMVTGDEPTGLIPAHLFAGAASVVGTLWPINDTLSGEAFSRTFYSHLAEELKLGPANLARLVQKAVKEIRSRPETCAPYFWAPFVLHGAWILE